jgi:predicted DNA-binding transcriptional regulator AlpA
MTRKEVGNERPRQNELDPLLHPVQVAKLLGVSLSWLAKSRMNGTGPRFVKIGRAVRYALSAVQDYIRSRQRLSTSEQ